MEPTLLPPSVVLNLAADYLQVYGWTRGKGWLSKHGEPTCLEGACDLVINGATESALARYAMGNRTRDVIREYLTSAYPELINRHTGTVFGWWWNDTPGRTKSEVIGALRAAAVIAETHQADVAAAACADFTAREQVTA